MDQLTQPPRSSASSRHVHWRAVAFVLLLLAYLLVIIGVVYQSPLLTIDRDVLRLDLHRRWPSWYSWIHTYVVLGQRGPSTLVALPWFAWRAWKSRSARPLVMLATALIVLNLSVGVVKVATGRLGPLRTHQVHAVFEGGNIFPSGHTANAIVLYGVIAMLAASWRTFTIVLAAIAPLTVGLSTIYLDTHWLTDVVGGWMAGGLVLLALPTMMPFAERIFDPMTRRTSRAWRRLRGGPAPMPTPAAPALADRARTPVRQPDSVSAKV